MDNFKKLAKEIHKRDNKQSIGVCVGTVVKAEQPIKVSICGGAILLEQGENAFVCQDVIERKYTAKARDSSVAFVISAVVVPRVSPKTAPRHRSSQ